MTRQSPWPVRTRIAQAPGWVKHCPRRHLPTALNRGHDPQFHVLADPGPARSLQLPVCRTCDRSVRGGLLRRTWPSGTLLRFLNPARSRRRKYSLSSCPQADTHEVRARAWRSSNFGDTLESGRHRLLRILGSSHCPVRMHPPRLRAETDTVLHPSVVGAR
jgi:hypothetical protein